MLSFMSIYICQYEKNAGMTFFFIVPCKIFVFSAFIDQMIDNEPLIHNNPCPVSTIEIFSR